MSEDPKAGPDGAAEAAATQAPADESVAPADSAAADVDAADAAPGDGEELTVEALQAALEQARAEAADAVDRALRAQAEAENTRRRAAQEVDKARKFALEKFSGDLLPVVDSLEKAVQSLEAAGAADQPDPAVLDTLGDGVRLSLKLFSDTLEKSGVVQLDPHGEPFDPQFHEAMAMVPNPAMEPNSVMDVVQKGYTLNGRLLRAAMVVVTKAPDAGVDTTV